MEKGIQCTCTTAAKAKWKHRDGNEDNKDKKKNQKHNLRDSCIRINKNSSLVMLNHKCIDPSINKAQHFPEK